MRTGDKVQKPIINCMYVFVVLDHIFELMKKFLPFEDKHSGQKFGEDMRVDVR